VSPIITLQRIEQQRDRVYRRTRTRRVRTLEGAARFIDEVGFSLLFASTQSIELPSLFEAVKGRRDAHIEEWDADSDRVWVWKNDLPAMHRAYYGKALGGGKPVFIALKLLPYWYALNAPDNLQRAYARGELSRDAKRVCDALSAMGPMPTMALAETAGFGTARERVNFHRALDDLQKRMVVAPVGAVNERGAWPSQLFALVANWFSREVARADQLDVDKARRVIAKHYIETTRACKLVNVCRVFGWSREIAQTTMGELLDRRIVSVADDWFISSRK
jgi:hypothetical protein